MSLAALRDRFIDLYSRLDSRQRLLAVVGAGAAVFALAFLALSAGQEPQMAVAFSGLNRDDASAIVARLRDQGIAYSISGDETAVRVPAGQVHDVRLDMASAGLPSGGTVGFEIFDSTNLGMTDFTQQLNYRRALEGELARTVASLEAVQEARVHIVIPQPSIYTEAEKPPTASVLLQLRAGTGLTNDHVRGIAHLVASSVEGLSPKDITILDTRGRVLSDALSDSEGQARDEQFEAQRAYERAVEAKIRSMLDTTLGPGRAAVSVSAQFDWTEVQTSREIYETPAAGTPVVRSAREIRETQGEADPVAQGSAGVDANIPSVPSYTGTLGMETTAGGATDPGYERSDVTYNYEVSKVVSQTIARPGRLERLSVSVLLDSIADEELLANVRQAVAVAAGTDPARGDQVTVETFAFDRTHVEAEESARAEEQRQELYITAAQWGAVAVGLIVVVLLVRGLFFRHAPTAPQATTITSRHEALEAGAQLALSRAEATAALEPGEHDRPLADLAGTQHQLVTLAQRQPEVLAQVIQFWLGESTPERRQ